MYQSLIWLVMLRNDAGGMRAPFDAERLQGETNALIDSMRRDVELGRDFFRIEMLVDEQKAVELALRELCDPRSQFFVHIARIVGPRRHIHEHISEQTVPNTAGKTRVRNNLRRFGSIEQIRNGSFERNPLLGATIFLRVNPDSVNRKFAKVVSAGQFSSIRRR